MKAWPLAALVVLSCTRTETESAFDPGVCGTLEKPKLACVVLPGEFPSPRCEAAKGACGGGGCPIASRCGAQDTCLPLSTNTEAGPWDFRVRRLVVSAPEVLATESFASTTVLANMDLAAKDCGESGYGGWNWIFRVDRGRGKLMTGGAPPSSDPLGLGYCFAKGRFAGHLVVPQESDTSIRGDTLSSKEIPKLMLPIFVKGDLSSVTLLPLSDLAFRFAEISKDRNCVGSFRPSALAPDCRENLATCSRWASGGSLSAHITLEEADSVPVSSYSESLCALLTKTGRKEPGSGEYLRCPRDASGNIVPQGDYCARTHEPCGCRDSFWLAATFAASAVRIHDGVSIPGCSP